MLRFLIVTIIIFGSGVYFYFYQLWPQRQIRSKAIRISSDRHFILVYRFIQISTPIYAGLSLADYQLPWGMSAAWIGLSLSTVSVLLFIWSMLSLRGKYSHCFDSYVPDSHTDRGPYGFVRHPIYVANCLMLVGLFLSTASWGVLINCVVLAIYYYRAACREEASLAQHLLGYAEYQRRTGKFLPRLARGRPEQWHARTSSAARALLFGLIAVFSTHAGCVVPQPPGKGTVSHQVEPKTRAGYWLYLPDDYVRNKGRSSEGQRWPVVVTFHGTKPFDNANPQIREWQQEADRYGFIVIAPELRTCDIFMQFPLNDPTLPYVQHDEKATLAIMAKVFSETDADSSSVLCTGWSTGGYMAHYMANRHPDRFCCLAVRESPFSEGMLDPAQAPKYHDMKVAIFFGENDFPVCRAGGRRAVQWYRNNGFSVEAKSVVGAGHERIPQFVAAFFASSIGVAPRTPPNLTNPAMKDVVLGSDH